MRISRRKFCGITGGTVASLAFSNACRLNSNSAMKNNGRRFVRPHTPTGPRSTGQVMLGLDRERDAILQLPKTAADSPLPLLLMLHGAGQSADDMFWYLGSAHEDAGVAVLASNSRDYTWDAIGGGFGPDVEFLNQALQRVFDTVAVDPARLAVGGFSD